MFSGVVTGDIKNLIESSSRMSKLSTRQQSEDSIHKQLTAFERLLQHTMSRFSKENLYHMLRHVTKWAESDQNPRPKHATKVAFKIRSLHQLRDIVASMKAKQNIKSSEVDNVMKYYELFLNDILYLKDLKKYFDDEIHRQLLKYHLDTTLDDVGSSMTSRYITEDEDSGNGSQAETDDNKTVYKLPYTIRKNANESAQKDTKESEIKYKETINELQTIVKKWEGLLSDEAVLDLNDFDPDSYHELMKFNNYAQFEIILRMVPDIFAKCYKCIDLAKTWLKMSNIVMKEIPRTPTPPALQTTQKQTADDENQQTTKDFMRQVRELQFQIENMDKSISDDETHLERCNSEMSDLIGRDDRYTEVSSDFSKIDSIITIAAGDYQKSKTEQYAVASKIKSCPKGSQKYEELKSHLRRLDSEVSQRHWKVKLLEFEKSTVQEDYLIEMEVRPSFIRFVGDTKEKIQDLERFLQVKREEKLKLEKQLALLKTNADRMRTIMRSYLGSASANGKGLSRASSELSEDNSETFAENGNEADVDSSGPYDIEPVKNNIPTHTLTLEDYIHQKPKIVKADKPKVRDLRPLSERTGNEKAKTVTKPLIKGPKASLKTTPRRVWEDC